VEQYGPLKGVDPMSPQQAEKSESEAIPTRWKPLNASRFFELGMIGSATGLAGGIIVLLLLGKLDVLSTPALLKYGTIIINLGTSIFLVCGAVRLATWSFKSAKK
jgi:hypothetical protein